MLLSRLFASATPKRITGIRAQSILSASPTAREFKVVLDNGTVYVDQALAEALGWTPDQPTEGVPLTLSGWEPHYFAIARTGTDSDLLARGTVESSRNPRVKQMLDYLKDR
ncbi:hypothetical protein C8Q70DRAFT_1050657 [Cubamyces menziesii]|uniref:Uncharacterized protein n=1 Tax=Trametes cubensis TaxID=1111947 RepID=A0AAD7X8Y1_9APHY|nr:hypothetical protein C8Q70DRAFT_1050657 [Cubamyces menziesii]KAJ8481578.1 hypothetical protein ONZ51_g5897 [Trametes cubensis]